MTLHWREKYVYQIFSEQERLMLDAEALQLLPGRDRSGRRIFVYFLRNVIDPNRPNAHYTRYTYVIATDVSRFIFV